MWSLVRRMHVCALAAVAALVAVPVRAQTPAARATAAQSPAPAQTAAASEQPTPQQVRDELNRLRQEFETVRDSYGARLSALEAKLNAMAPAQPAAAPPATPPVTPPAEPPVTPPAEPAQAPAPAAPPNPPAAGAPPPEAPAPGGAQAGVGVPEGAAGAGGPQGSLPVYGNVSALSKIFNPDMAVIGNFVGAVGENRVDPRPALALDEAEVSFQAVVDPYARADFFVSTSPEGAAVEEGYLTLTSLPGGLLAKVGKLKEQIGKVNTMHAHTLPWVDMPLVMRNLLGGDEGASDSGISLSKLILNPVMFLEATGEVYQGTAGPFQSNERSDVSWVGRLRGYRDVTEGTNLDIGASFARGHNDAGPQFTTRIFAVDATFRYRPLRRAIYRRFMGRTELMWSRRGQEPGDAKAFGMYASGDYQFAQRWFAGVRYDWSERAVNPSLTDKGPSLLVTYWPSEFSQVRGQFRRTTYAEGVTANEALFQFLFSIGAHGAHVF